MPQSAAQRKQALIEKGMKLFAEFNRALIIQCDNVGSNQMLQIRKSLRGKAVILMGKNTLIRKLIQLLKNPSLESLRANLKGNVGLVLTNDDLLEMKKLVESNRIAVAAKVGSISPIDVIIPSGPTGFDPSQTAIMQSLKIATKINKGQIEIISDVHLLKPGDRIDNSQAFLLGKLNIKPFNYGLTVIKVFDQGSVFTPDMLEITPEIIVQRFLSAVQNVAALSLQLRLPNVAALPHYIANGYQNVLAIAVSTELTFAQAQKIKQYLADPSAFAIVVETSTSTSTSTTTSNKNASSTPAVVEKVEEEKVEEEEEEGDLGLDLFG